MRATYLAPVLFAACTFSGPDGGDGTGNGPDADPGGGNGGGDGSQACADDDADTVCNERDDWPCGLKPDDPGGAMTDSATGRAWGAAFIGIGNSRRVVANPNQDFDVDFGWSFRVDCGGSSSCKAQLEIGYGANRVGCVYDNDVTSNQTRYGGANTQPRAPATPPVYEIRLKAGRRDSCGTNPWFIEDPGAESTIAILCVRP